MSFSATSLRVQLLALLGIILISRHFFEPVAAATVEPRIVGGSPVPDNRYSFFASLGG